MTHYSLNSTPIRQNVVKPAMKANFAGFRYWFKQDVWSPFFKPLYCANTGKPDRVGKITFALLSPWAVISCYFDNSKTPPHYTSRPQDTDLSQDYDINEVIEMALSDHTSFSDIKKLYGLSADEVKLIMRQNLKRGSYEAWRRRVRKFSDRREHYK